MVIDDLDEQLDRGRTTAPAVEGVAYYVMAEAIDFSGARQATVSARRLSHPSSVDSVETPGAHPGSGARQDTLLVTVTLDGGAGPAGAPGIAGVPGIAAVPGAQRGDGWLLDVEDRVGALGGHLGVTVSGDSRTTLRAELPCGS